MRFFDEFDTNYDEKVLKNLIFFSPKWHFGQKCAGQNGLRGDIKHKLLHRTYLYRAKMKEKSR